MHKTSAEAVLHAPAPAGPGAPLARFFIPAPVSFQERRSRTLKHGDSFGVFDHNGDIVSGPGSPEGLFHCDTRHLSHFLLTIDGMRPMLLSSTPDDDNVTLTCDLTNPDLYDEAGNMRLVHDIMHMRRSRFFWKDVCYDRLVVRNFDEQPHRVTLELSFTADFADLFEVRGEVRERRGRMLPPELAGDRVTLAYEGLDGQRRATTLRFDPPPDELDGAHAIAVLDLQPKESRSLFIEISNHAHTSRETPRRAFSACLRQARREMRTCVSRATSITTSHDIFNETVRRSVADLGMLITNTAEGPYPYAGIPWYSTVFGRDALVTALQTLWMDPEIARGVLGHLAANQATEIDHEADAEPGKILHEVRHGEMAELGEVPFRRYYGSIDSTPLFVMLAGAWLERTGDVEGVRKLWPNIEAALEWIEHYGDRDGDGFVEYGRYTDSGLQNQGWKDSHDSVFHADGTLAEGPIALAEVQAYTYGAWKNAAAVARALEMSEQAGEYERRAVALRTKFDEEFFDPDLGTYVLALDGKKKPCRVRTSNAGHVLLTGLAYPDRAPSVVRELMTPASFCGWGIRTVSSGEARFNPMSYHNGSVWPHDNSLIAAGFARYGFKQEAAKILEGIFAAASYIDLRRLPELLCGFPRQRTLGPTFYPVACTPQAWAAAAPLVLLQACLGLRFNAARNHITFEDPVLPSFLHEVVLHDLALGDGSIDVKLTRAETQVVVDVLERRGDVRVLAKT